MKVSAKPDRLPPSSDTLPWTDRVKAWLPGLGLTALLAALALGIGYLSHRTGIKLLNPLLVAVLLGIAVRQVVPLPAIYRPGIHLAMKRILRLAVILLGLRLSMAEIFAVGPVGLAMIASSTVSTFYLTTWLGRRLSVNPKLTRLIAAGTSICGASAIVATNAVVDGSEEDMTYAIATITGFGTLAMVSYPLMAGLGQLSPETFGLWCGASIHEVAQVIATAFQHSTTSGDIATVAKLSRVLLIVPILLGLGWQARGTQAQGEAPKALPIPWFVLFFAGLVLLNSVQLFPAALKVSVAQVNQVLLCMALAAMGLETYLDKLVRLGLKPLILAGLSWLFLSMTSLMLIQIMV
ncbi:MAG: YeiH family protein [Leptolyngbya sp.]|nr:YeiH family protein [Leptolyngbya sp.]